MVEESTINRFNDLGWTLVAVTIIFNAIYVIKFVLVFYYGCVNYWQRKRQIQADIEGNRVRLNKYLDYGCAKATI